MADIKDDILNKKNTSDTENLLEDALNNEDIDLDSTDKASSATLEETEDFIPDGHEKIDALQDTIESLQEELEVEKNAKLRALADYQNQKNRFDKEKKELISYSQTVLLLKVLDVLGDFQHSIQAFSEENTQSWKEGITMLYDKLVGVVEDEGVSIIKTEVGETFNPTLHEAISFINVEDESEDHKIAHVISNGYKKISTDQVIKTSKVIVNKKQ